MKLRALGLIPLLSTTVVWAGPEAKKSAPDAGEPIEATLGRYKDSFRKEMDAPLVKKGNSVVQKSGVQVFSKEHVASGDYVAAKDEVRSKTLKLVRGKKKFKLEQLKKGKAPIELNDQADALADSKSFGFVRSLTEMDAGLKSGAVAAQPWSDDYWGLYRGTLGARYVDSGFNNASEDDWKKYYDYTLLKSAYKIFEDAQLTWGGSTASLNRLSPSEKYDLLVGDTNFSLTKQQWSQGRAYYNQDANGDGKPDNKVETWMGICHGWAPAAFMVERPRFPVHLYTAKGNKPITFYPADIKALASLLWATSAPNAKFIGGRCNAKDPKKDADGRVLDQDCFDTNPGTWHMTAVNKIGREKKSFVMDVTYDYEVWNQPVNAYSYRYFNPATLQYADTLADAKADTPQELAAVKFAQHRGKWGNQKPASIVGIVMDVEYIVEVQPGHYAEDTPSMDGTQTARFIYDLELDASGKIIGGEWYSNTHPDFLWTFDSTDKAQSDGDFYAQGSWNSNANMIPSKWMTPAATSAQNGQPLSKIVNGLVERSQKSSPTPVSPTNPEI
jgi:hypothetical protein